MQNNKARTPQESTEKEITHGKTSQISEPSEFWFPVYEEIFEHAPTLRDAVWLFMWLVARTTHEAEGRGEVLGRSPIHDERPAKELGFPVKTIRRYRRMLIVGGYIETLRTPYGFRYTILKSKKWKSSKKRDLPKLPISTQESDQFGHRELPLRAERMPNSGVSKKTTQSRHREDSVSHDRRHRPNDGISLIGQEDFEDMEIKNLPLRFEPFVELVKENPRGGDERFVLWAKSILDLCGENGIEYPKIFYKRLKEAERKADNEQDPYGEMARMASLSRPPQELEVEPRPRTAKDYLDSLETVETLIQTWEPKCAPKKVPTWLLDLKAEYEKKIAELSEPVPKTP